MAEGKINDEGGDVDEGGQMTDRELSKLGSYLLQAPELFSENANLLITSLNPPAELTGMSKDIWNLANDHKPTIVDLFLRLNIWKILKNFFQTEIPDYGIHMGGSTLNGFGLKSSDIDFTILTRSKVKLRESKTRMTQKMKPVFIKLQKSPLVTQAAMRSGMIGNKPYIYFKDAVDNLNIDVTMDSMISMSNSHLLFRYAQVDWRVQPLGIIIKLFVKHQNLVGLGYKTLSSIHFALLLIYYLQCGVNPAVLPCLQRLGKAQQLFSSKMRIYNIDYFKPLNTSHFKRGNVETLEDLLLGFFKFYSTFNFEANIISVRLAKVTPKEQFMQTVKKKYRGSYNKSCLHIEEPFDLRNTAGKITKTNLNKVRSAFTAVHKKLSETRDIRSIFSKLD